MVCWKLSCLNVDLLQIFSYRSFFCKSRDILIRPSSHRSSSLAMRVVSILGEVWINSVAETSTQMFLYITTAYEFLCFLINHVCDCVCKFSTAYKWVYLFTVNIRNRNIFLRNHVVMVLHKSRNPVNQQLRQYETENYKYKVWQSLVHNISST